METSKVSWFSPFCGALSHSASCPYVAQNNWASSCQPCLGQRNLEGKRICAEESRQPDNPTCHFQSPKLVWMSRKSGPHSRTVLPVPAELCPRAEPGELALGLGPSSDCPTEPVGNLPKLEGGRFHPAPAGSGEPHMGLLAEAQASSSSPPSSKLQRSPSPISPVKVSSWGPPSFNPPRSRGPYSCGAVAPTLPAPSLASRGPPPARKSNPPPGPSGAGNAAEFRWNFEVEKHLGREKERGEKEWEKKARFWCQLAGF